MMPIQGCRAILSKHPAISTKQPLAGLDAVYPPCEGGVGAYGSPPGGFITYSIDFRSECIRLQTQVHKVNN